MCHEPKGVHKRLKEERQLLFSVFPQWRRPTVCSLFSNHVCVFRRSYLNQSDVLKPLLNPMYEPNNSVLWPSVASQSLVSFYCKTTRHRHAKTLRGIHFSDNIKTMERTSETSWKACVFPAWINFILRFGRGLTYNAIFVTTQVLWPGLFLKWRESNKNEDILWEEVRRVQEINTDLKSKAISLRR